MYYYFGHIAAFVAPGATRLGVQSHAPVLRTPLHTAAFLTPDYDEHAQQPRRLVVVAMNRDSSAHKAAIVVPPRGTINVHMPASSIRTFVFDWP